ncbi:alpha/beta hydrolase family protein [Streptomyces sp. Amel2xB2]|uniref:alpha/beta hydrolase n=1 Tax=Streptomyces sp. Amel2xB2 TaxID=1305829 RepID=UPI000DB9A690|nr:alpha/beta hydrolase [Streptomyces sp. Amel2xB2]RAJ65592.1 alpha/beta hydrolase family protein [Streptomyces sp. Amel2xB2]
MKRRVIAVYGGAAVVLAGLITAIPVAANAGSADAEGTSAAAGKLKWTDCATEDYPDLQCSKVRVPLDYKKTDGKKITIALSRVQHTASKSQGPLLVNPGGPGGSGLTLAGFVAKSLPKKVASQYDVIGFDPRGVGKSEPALDCQPGSFDPVRPDSVPRNAKDEKANIDRAQDFAKACGKKHGKLLRHINTVNAVKDMDRIRAAVGSKKINYFGYSYGTYLGAVYAKIFPDRVRRAVLDSIVDPDGVWYEDNISQDYAFEGRQKAFTAWVAKHDAEYKLGKDPEAVEKAWYKMRAALKKKPAGGTVGASELEDTFIPGGYFNGYWPDLATAFASFVNDKDTAPIVEAYKAMGSVDAEGDNGYSIYTSVQCRDASWPRDWGTWHRDTEKVYEKAPFMAWNNAWYNAPCAFWPVKSQKALDVSNKKLPPVLLFQATDDAATPYEGGISMHRKLSGSRLVVEEGGGNHGITLGGSECLDKHLADYLATGKVPKGKSSGDADATCKALPDPEPLSPEKAKAAVPAPYGSQGGSDKAGELHRLVGNRG